MSFLYLAFASIILIGGIALLRRRRNPEPGVDTGSAEYFRDRCQRLLDANKLDELIAYTRDWIARRPNHTCAHWYLARALYLQQKWPEALRAFNEVARLDPSWIEDSVTPHVRAIEAKLRPRAMPTTSDAPEQRTLH